MMGNMATTTGVIRVNERRRGLNPETAIQIGIMQYLRRIMEIQKYKKFMAFHVPNGGKRNAKEGGLFKTMGVMPGVADIVVLVPPQRIVISTLPAKTIFIELKYQPQRIAKKTTSAGKMGKIVNTAAKGQQDSQKLFQQRTQDLGFDYHLVAALDARDGLNQVLKIMEKYGVNA